METRLLLEQVTWTPQLLLQTRLVLEVLRYTTSLPCQMHLPNLMSEFAFADSADTEASQPAADTTNKCDLEVPQYLDDSNKDLEMFFSTGNEALRAAQCSFAILSSC